MTKKISENILILGGGPAGMSCAMELHKAGKNSIIIEKNSKIGGMAKTLEFKENKYIFKTDIGPHRFFSKNKYLYDFIKKLLDKDWIIVKRKTQQFINNKYYDYPVNALQSFKNIGLSNTIKIGLSYLNGITKHHIFKKKIKNFEDYIIANFGKKLGEFNMLNYTEKIWGINCKKIHPDWAKQRIKGLDLVSTLKNIISKNKNKPKTLVDEFYYPAHGTGLIYETIAKKIKKGRSRINTNSYPTKIKHNKNKIMEIELKINGKRKIIYPSSVVSSIPINEFINNLVPKPPTDILNAANKLKWRSQVYLFITLNRKKVTDNNWIYFPNKEIPFGRVSEMKNFSKNMNPENKTSLFVEFFVTENDIIWNMNKQEIFNLAMKYFKKLNLFSEQEVRNFYVFKKKHVYPVYDLDYKEYLEKIKKYLNSFKNLYYIGRLGRFQYTNQDHSLEMGIVTAKNIIENKKYDLDNIGSEKEYFERGHIKK